MGTRGTPAVQRNPIREKYGIEVTSLPGATARVLTSDEGPAFIAGAGSGDLQVSMDKRQVNKALFDALRTLPNFISLVQRDDESHFFFSDLNRISMVDYKDGLDQPKSAEKFGFVSGREAEARIMKYVSGVEDAIGVRPGDMKVTFRRPVTAKYIDDVRERVPNLVGVYKGEDGLTSMYFAPKNVVRKPPQHERSYRPDAER